MFHTQFNTLDRIWSSSDAMSEMENLNRKPNTKLFPKTVLSAVWRCNSESNTYVRAILLPSMIIIRFSNNSGFSLNSFSCISRLTFSFFLDSRLLSAPLAVLFDVFNDRSAKDVDGFFVSNRLIPRSGVLARWDRWFRFPFGGDFNFAFCGRFACSWCFGGGWCFAWGERFACGGSFACGERFAFFKIRFSNCLWARVDRG